MVGVVAADAVPALGGTVVLLLHGDIIRHKYCKSKITHFDVFQ